VNAGRFTSIPAIEPWAGGYTDPNATVESRSNYAMRMDALELRTKDKPAPTAVLTHGANPGLVSHLVKQALPQHRQGHRRRPPARRRFARTGPGSPRSSGSRSSTLRSGTPRWRTRRRSLTSSSILGRWTASSAKARNRPNWDGARTRSIFPRTAGATASGLACAIYLNRPGASTRVRTWTPEAGHFHGFLITHSEAISLADYYTVKEGARVVYRPTSHYAYHPCNDAVLSVHEFAGRNWHLQDRKRILLHQITKGIDELGVLLAGHAKNAYWYGSQLSIEEARLLAPFNSATSLQVTSAALAGMIWAMENPARGIVEPDDMDFRRPLENLRALSGFGRGRVHDWTPLHERGELFREDLDLSDPWQFKNVRVV